MSEIFSKKLKNFKFVTFNDKPDFSMDHVKQIHSNIVVKAGNCIEADGLYFENDFNTPVAIVTADCLPISVYGKKGSAFLHAGWRGLALGIITTDEVKNLDPIEFFIGPHISHPHYEVTEEFRDHFPPGKYYIEKDNKLYFDLGLCAREIILKAFPQASVEDAKTCTYEHLELRSYRENATAMRNWNVLLPFVD